MMSSSGTGAVHDMHEVRSYADDARGEKLCLCVFVCVYACMYTCVCVCVSK